MHEIPWCYHSRTAIYAKIGKHLSQTTQLIFVYLSFLALLAKKQFFYLMMSLYYLKGACKWKCGSVRTHTRTHLYICLCVSACAFVSARSCVRVRACKENNILLFLLMTISFMIQFQCLKRRYNRNFIAKIF